MYIYLFLYKLLKLIISSKVSWCFQNVLQHFFIVMLLCKEVWNKVFVVSSGLYVWTRCSDSIWFLWWIQLIISPLKIDISVMKNITNSITGFKVALISTFISGFVFTLVQKSWSIHFFYFDVTFLFGIPKQIHSWEMLKNFFSNFGLIFAVL